MSLLGWIILIVVLVAIFGNGSYGRSNTAWRSGPYYSPSYVLLIVIAIVLIFFFGIGHHTNMLN